MEFLCIIVPLGIFILIQFLVIGLLADRGQNLIQQHLETEECTEIKIDFKWNKILRGSYTYEVTYIKNDQTHKAIYYYSTRHGISRGIN